MCAELGPEYCDAVVASFLERVDQEIAARVGARLAGMGQPEPPTGLDHGRNLLKGVGADWAAPHRGERASVRTGPRVGQR